MHSFFEAESLIIPKSRQGRSSTSNVQQQNRCANITHCGLIVSLERAWEHVHSAQLRTDRAKNSGRNRNMNRCRLAVLYGGRVQGVGFRYTVKSIAPGFEVTGTIRNLPDGSVELIAEGLREELEAFQQAVRDSGLGPLITREDISWGTARNDLRGFEIVR
jgi:acylphosphatase